MPSGAECGWISTSGTVTVPGEVGSLPVQPRVWMVADIGPGPAVERALAAPRSRSPAAGRRRARRARSPRTTARRSRAAIASAVQLRKPVAKIRRLPPSGIERQHVGTVLFGPSVPTLLAEPTETNIVRPSRENTKIACPVAAGRQMRHDHLRPAARPQIAGPIGKPHHPIWSPPHRRSADRGLAARRRCRTAGQTIGEHDGFCRMARRRRRTRMRPAPLSAGKHRRSAPSAAFAAVPARWRTARPRNPAARAAAPAGRGTTDGARCAEWRCVRRRHRIRREMPHDARDVVMPVAISGRAGQRGASAETGEASSGTSRIGSNPRVMRAAAVPQWYAPPIVRMVAQKPNWSAAVA